MSKDGWWRRSRLLPAALLAYLVLLIWEPQLHGIDVVGRVFHWSFLALGIWYVGSGARRVLQTAPRPIDGASDLAYAAGWATLFISGDGTGTEDHRLF